VAGPRRDQVLLLSLLAVLAVVVGAIGFAVWQGRDQGGDAAPLVVDTSSDPLDATRADIIAAFDGYLRVTAEANHRGDPYYDGLGLYIDALYGLKIAQGIIERNDNGTYYAGELKAEAAVESVDLDAEPATATISACMDATDYHLLYRRDDSPVPGVNALTRYPAEATAMLSDDGRWLIVETTARLEETC
jgi:hypothetical protein